MTTRPLCAALGRVFSSLGSPESSVIWSEAPPPDPVLAPSLYPTSHPYPHPFSLPPGPSEMQWLRAASTPAAVNLMSSLPPSLPGTSFSARGATGWAGIVGKGREWSQWPPTNMPALHSHYLHWPSVQWFYKAETLTTLLPMEGMFVLGARAGRGWPTLSLLGLVLGSGDADDGCGDLGCFAVWSQSVICFQN